MGRGFDSHFRAIGIVQLVRTIEIEGSNPSHTFNVNTQWLSKRRENTFFQSASLLKRCTRKKTDLSLSVVFL